MNNLIPLSILLVDDNTDHAELMVDALHDFNVKNTIRHVVDGEQAILYLRHLPPYENPEDYPLPDLIFLDLRMPRQDGMTTLSMIKNDDQLKHIPVVMVSTSKTADEIKECYSLGANGYINKPLQFEEFSRKIKELNYYWVLTAELPSQKEDKSC